MKKVLLTTLLLASSAAVADSALTGIHLGVDAGLQRVDFNQYLDTATRSKVKKPSYQMTGAASLGYFKDSGDLHYGAKFSFGHVFGDRTKNVKGAAGAYTGVKLKTKQQYSLTFAGQVGTYVSQDTVVYGSLGIKRMRYDLEIKTNTIGGTTGKTLWGPVIGLGMKKSLTDSWAFNSDLSYEFYSKTQTGNLGTTANKLGMSIQPRIWSVSFGFSRKF